MKKQYSEESIIRQLKADNIDALKQVYTKFKPEFLNYAKRFDLSKDDVLDVYQDAIIALYQKFVIQNLELKTSGLKTYLFGIGKNMLLQKLKIQQRLSKLNTIADEVNEVVIEHYELDDRTKALALQIDKLSKSCQTLLKLFYYRNLTIKEIVLLTNYKDGNTIRSHKSRCIKRLKNLLKAH